MGSLNIMIREKGVGETLLAYGSAYNRADRITDKRVRSGRSCAPVPDGLPGLAALLLIELNGEVVALHSRESCPNFWETLGVC